MSAEPSPSDEPVIEMSGVAVGSRQEPETVVLKDVNWRVAAGDYWVVAGLHGSGKSDFIALAGGLTRPQGGSYRLFGHPMPIFEEELLGERLRLGVVFEDSHLQHRLSVAENVALPWRYHRSANAAEVAGRVAAMLEWTGLTPWADSQPGRLGRNWQKRAMLARALMLEPEVLVLDNPIGGLDSRHALWWLDFLGQLSAGADFLKGRRLTVVATAEDFRPWQDRASHFAILQQGRFVPLGERSVLAGHSDPLVKELLRDGFARR
jgi:ABC-type transporter Mla maintaining outer membrane lipid asymmetry ATPase subunit MlaF